MRVALGTVQFGLEYGVANTRGKPTEDEVASVIRLARDADIDTLDTAIAYGNSESVLGNIGVADWKIITKLPAVPDDVPDIEGWVIQQVRGSLSRLQVSRIHGLMLHRPDQLFLPFGRRLYQALLQTKSIGLVEKIGISVYHQQEIEHAFEHMSFDCVQVPFSILDRRLLQSGFLATLHASGVEVFARSVFLQGLLLFAPSARPKQFDRWKPVWGAWDQWVSEENLSRVEACVRYALSFSEIHKIVVGVQDVSQLLEIVSAVRKPPLVNVPEFDIADNRLLDPASWSQLT